MLTFDEKKLWAKCLKDVDRKDLIGKVMSKERTEYNGTPEEVIKKLIEKYPEKIIPKYSRE